MTETLSPAADDAAVLDMEWIPGGVDPKTLIIRDNVRLNDRVAEDAELLYTVKHRGVRTAINVYRDEDGSLVVLRGHRRTLAAVMGDVARVPVLVEPKPTPQDRIVDQLIENDHRRGLAPAEHVNAYHQLELLGLDTMAIAERSGTPVEKVSAGLTVAHSPAAREAVKKHVQLDAVAAQVYAEFADDENAIADLDQAVEEGNWSYRVRELRQRRRRDQVRAQAEDALEREHPGLTVLRGLERLNYWHQSGKVWRVSAMRSKPGSEKEMTVKAHEKCPGHGAAIELDHKGYDSDNEQILVPKTVWLCTNAPKYRHESLHATDGSTKLKLDEMDPEEAAAKRAESAMTRANNEAMRTATSERLDFLKSLMDRKKAPAGADRLICAAMFRDQDVVRFAIERSSKLAHRMFGMELGQYESTKQEFREISDGLGDERAKLFTLINVLCAYEQNVDQSAWRLVDGARQRYLKFLVSAGYVLSPVEEMAAGLREVENLDRQAEVLA